MPCHPHPKTPTRTGVLLVAILALAACEEKTEDTSFPDPDGDGWTLLTGDCDDDNPDINPGATEVCDDDDVDENCNDLADDDDPSVLESSQTWYYQDEDGDGYAADDAVGRALCEPTGSWQVTDLGDCDDDDANVNPGATEVCDDDDIDEDCSGTADNDDPDVDSSTTSTWYPDSDGDGFGDDDESVELCDEPSGYTTHDGDCDDGDPDINPDATERCDEDDVDENCNGWADDIDFDIDPDSLFDWYADSDGDGYGDSSTSTQACDAPSGTVGDITEPDCDDEDADINPGATEICDAGNTDEDCNGLADDEDPDLDPDSLGSWYFDGDADGYGDAATFSSSCDGASGLVSDGTDCDDTDPGVNPGATEVCDDLDVDEDCSGTADDDDSGVDTTTTTSWYVDSDADGYGDATSSTAACEQPSGHVDDDSDCDDAEPDVNPGATEICDDLDVDEDCSGLADDDDPGVDPASLGSWYADADADGYGDPGAGTVSCEQPSGTVTDGSDCNDTRDDVNPGQVEICDEDDLDENCSGLADDADPAVDSGTTSTWYADVDADGFGDLSTSTQACDQPSGHVVDGTDCDDTRDDVSPDGSEVCDEDDADEDCSGLADDADGGVDPGTFQTFWEDTDGDAYGDSAAQTLACDLPSGHVTNDDDCDDTRADVSPGGTEVCDSSDVDEDCDGSSDDDDASVDSSTYDTWYADMDSDGYGDAATTDQACDQPLGHVADDTDCDDTRADVSPTGSEVCDDLDADEDCDGNSDDDDAGVDISTFASWYADDDGDGYGDAATTDQACDQPSGHVADDTDCDDSRADINPEGDEVCDSLDADEDCDGSTDDDDASVDSSSFATWYADSDSDGYGDAASTQQACDPPSSHVADSTDCDDGRADVSPAGSEVCDSLDTDEDCDGASDDLDASVDASTFSTWYADSDSDGYGDSATTSQACDQPTGHVADDSDCDDARDDINPGQTEICDASDSDEDCSGAADDADPAVDSGTLFTWYADLDSDTYGDASSTSQACNTPAGHVADDTDCDDSSAAINPSETEICDTADADEDCSGASDDDDPGVDASTFSTWYADSDGDGYGDAATSSEACDLPSGSVTDADDCDDTRDDVNPGETEICDDDNVDEDCNGLADDDDLGVDASTQLRWYRDLDGDGVGSSTYGMMSPFCDQPTGYADQDGDCDETRTDIHALHDEICDGIDNDCDAATSEDGVISLGSDAHADLASAVAAASAGDTVMLCDGTHVATVTTTVSLTLQSLNGESSTELNGGGEGPIVTMGDDLAVIGLAFADSVATNGGAIDGSGAAGALLEVVDCAFESNEATNGGAIYAGGLLLSISGSELSNNLADQGGALWASDSEISDTSFHDNLATDKGGALYLDDGTSADLEDVDVYGNEASSGGGAWIGDITVEGGSYYTNNATSGGAVYVDGGTLQGADITANIATSSGGGAVLDDDASLLGSTVTQNLAQRGGGVSIHGDGASVDEHPTTGIATTISENEATVYGGGISGIGANAVTLSNAEIGNNTAYYGGGIYVQNCDLLVSEGLIVSDNSVSNTGGGLYLTSTDEISVQDLTLTDNTAGSSGGGGYVSNCADSMDVDSVVITGNQAGSLGGGFYLSSVTAASFSSMTLELNSGAGLNGGGFYLDSGVDLSASGSSWGTGTTDNSPDDIGMSGRNYSFTSWAECDSDLMSCTGS